MSRARHGSGRGVSPQMIAMSVIAVVIAAVATIFFLMGPKEPEPEPEPEAVNPFEGLAPEEEPARQPAVEDEAE